jgi:hypothetical protein|eukprot:COSAG01_NODE_6943_length_3429_cov_3.730030_3_plen_81_part_00
MVEIGALRPVILFAKVPDMHATAHSVQLCESRWVIMARRETIGRSPHQPWSPKSPMIGASLLVVVPASTAVGVAHFSTQN